ncbi:hypothetical protein ASD79_00655 [Caulobacter sp. Root655]|uniref:GspE/PulE family protein n=1 Tax=Caulobacter sp. Root655 TaxID=1736578 RepID=UPI0006F30688|nr:GspE/PulE family protein [Caulobacter sp. Root655]KRA65828.1 hypothetical protein ASD79_00655 [Caulobacter sp. Root655]
METRRLGELLRAEGLIADRDLSSALTLQTEIGGRLGGLLLRLGAVAEADLLAVLSRQLDVPVLPAEARPTAQAVEAFLADAGPRIWWADREAVAWRGAEGRLFCAALDPLAPLLRERLAQLTDEPVAYHLASRAFIDGFRPGATAGLEHGATSDAARLRELALEAPVIDFVNGLFAEALNRRASDVHLEPFERRFVVRMRIDGQLVDMRAGPRADFDAVCSRIKLLSGMDIGERRLPQDGRQSIRVAGQELDLRVSTLPSAWGESLVLRLLGKSSRLQTLAELGLDADRAHRLVAMVEKPNGVVLVSGPTGSGKTTTIYRLLTHLHNGARKIVTIEDPIEFDLPGVVQVQARGDIGLTFAAGLRSILRQDPDVIMVGEIRDPETARIAIQAALTGHMVISTVHTNSALAAVARLKDLGVEGFLLADVVRGVVGQRLARRLCVHCTRPSDPAQAAVHERAAAEWGVVTADEPGRWAEPVGCERCAGTGYLGRFGLYEIADGDAALERCIRDGADEAAMERAARRRGFINLFEDGVAKARLGLTTLAEISRIAAPAETPLETA